ncbi:hypothetical protein [Flavobacterium salmonis]|uniref:Lipoprotein n=1 Tax=Flavobacterium salmonis TaxID=2654844 RepID=A0A6V6ZDA0_9FLAO|nr:hypothetical protein [Flavobacterium salmonis]CAD0009750.1 hypothetical protein FLAT13_05077 [Flavobacterium salmonis]
MRKIFVLFMFTILLTSCKDDYEQEELKAIEDVANDYLKTNDLLLNPTKFFDDQIIVRPNIDNLDIKVYFSDDLLPISQVKEDNEWMFTDNNFKKASDSITFFSILNSQKFKDLKFREFAKSKLKLERPYTQFKSSQTKFTADEEYRVLNFSRVCFDDKRENGIVVIEYLVGYESGTSSGYHNSLLIKKKNGKWTYVRRK